MQKIFIIIIILVFIIFITISTMLIIKSKTNNHKSPTPTPIPNPTPTPTPTPIPTPTPSPNPIPNPTPSPNAISKISLNINNNNMEYNAMVISNKLNKNLFIMTLDQYKKFDLSNNNINILFTIDVSKINPGCYTSLKFVNMKNNNYCDINTNYCTEIDVFQANKYGFKTTPHYCSTKNECDFNGPSIGIGGIQFRELKWLIYNSKNDLVVDQFSKFNTEYTFNILKSDYNQYNWINNKNLNSIFIPSASDNNGDIYDNIYGPNGYIDTNLPYKVLFQLYYDPNLNLGIFLSQKNNKNLQDEYNIIFSSISNYYFLPKNTEQLKNMVMILSTNTNTSTFWLDGCTDKNNEWFNNNNGYMKNVPEGEGGCSMDDRYCIDLNNNNNQGICYKNNCYYTNNYTEFSNCNKPQLPMNCDTSNIPISNISINIK